jgi:hypothetical protein
MCTNTPPFLSLACEFVFVHTHSIFFEFYLFYIYITYDNSIRDQSLVQELDGRVEFAMTGMLALRAAVCS